MNERRAARPSGSYGRANVNGDVNPDIVRENYERGCRWAARAWCAAFAFMAFGAAVFGW